MSGFAVSGGDIIDVFAGGYLDTGTTNWLSQRNEGIIQSVGAHAREFFTQAQSMFTMISQSDATMLLRNLQAKNENTWAFNIVAIPDLVGLQTANPYMQRWIMAQPDLRQRYLNQEVEGYGDSYVNQHGDVWGDRHFDYRRVMDGIVTHDEDSFKYTQYYEAMGEHDRDLTLFEKIDILRTWNLVQHHLDAGEDDPTSVTGAKL